MCGRFTLKTPPDQWSQLLLPIIDFEPLRESWQPRYNIAPTQSVVGIVHEDKGEPSKGRQEQTPHKPRAEYLRWGLVPGWAENLSIGNRMINARRETLLEKRSFSGPLKKRRCLILGDGYYEWRKVDSKTKQAYWITPPEGELLLFAGLWEANSRAAPQTLRSCTIITTAAVESLASIHDRMPACLQGAAARQWLDMSTEAEAALRLLDTAAEVAEKLQIRPVSSYVNNARHEGEQCLQAP